MTTRPDGFTENQLVVDEMRWLFLNVDRAAGTLTGTVRIRIAHLAGRPPLQAKPGQVAIFRVIRNGFPYGTFTPVTPTISINGNPFGGLSGPFLVSGLTDTNGYVDVNVQTSGWTVGDTFTLNLELLGQPVAPTRPSDITRINSWVMPKNTVFEFPSDCRCLDVTF